MFSRHPIIACCILLFSCTPAAIHAQKVPSSRHRYSLKNVHSPTKVTPRRLQNNKNIDKNNINGNKNRAKDVEIEMNPPTIRPSAEPTTQPTSLAPSPRPTLPPTAPPVIKEIPDDLWDTQAQTYTTPTTTNNNNNQITLTMDELQDIQYFGGGQITLRFSLWFQEEMPASQVGGGPTLAAVLDSLQKLMCESRTELLINDNNNNNNKQGDDDKGDPLGMDTLDWTDATKGEDRELCLVPVELGGAEVRSSSSGQRVEGSVLLQPPTTFVVDRTASEGGLHWTTWKVTWDVLRLGTFYILQGLENAGSDVATMQEEEIYRAGIGALEGILELALDVSIREQTFDKALVGSMVYLGNSEGIVLASVYGEEEESLLPKLEWLGIAASSGQDGDQVVEPTSVTTSEVQPTETTVSAIADEGGEEDDSWDDDHYSMEYGITETLNPPFWHPLRIVGIFMFMLTTCALVSLLRMSRRRQARREMERKMAKEGLLNDPQGVEELLNASATRANEFEDGSNCPTNDLPTPNRLNLD